MKRYKKILVPYDYSDLAKLAYEQAISLAAMVDGEVTVLHVIEENPYRVSNFETTEIISALRSIELENKSRLENMIQDIIRVGRDQGSKVNYLLKEGNVSDTIIKESSNYDLIIMGTLGQSALETLFMGSVAEKVARHACCPVMLVREIGKECNIKDN
jgi:nucleotide-binding universal stress UspA family protein